MSKSSTNTAPQETSLSTVDQKDPGSKALRNDPKTEAGGGGGVFRLDSMAPGAAEAGGDAFGAQRKPKLSQSALFFVVLLVVGGGILFFMRQIGIGPIASFAKLKAPDYDVTKDLKGKTGDHKRVLKDLSESSVKTQVPIDQVQKNPFKLSEMINSNPDPADSSEAETRAATERARREAENRRKQVDGVLANLRLHGVLGGSTPIARINEKAVRIGDKVEELFVVKSIEGRTVELECDGQTYTISMEDPGAAPTKGTRKK